MSPQNFTPADARLSNKGDWSISVDMAEDGGDRRLVAHIGHGIPYGFFEISDGAAVIELEDGGMWDDAGVIAIGDKRVIYAGVRGVTYAVYVPTRASVGVPDGRRLTVKMPPGAGYFSIAAVPGRPDQTDPELVEEGRGGAKTLPEVGDLVSNAGAEKKEAYETVTLDWEDGASDVNPDWAFGGAVSSAAVQDRVNVLKFAHPVGSESWAGVSLIEAPGGTDLIADRSQPVGMRVWAETNGSVTLVMEDISSIRPEAGAARYVSVTEDVVGGRWNDVVFDFGSPDSASEEPDTDHNKLVLKVNEGNTLYVDKVTLHGAYLIERISRSTVAAPTRPGQDVAELFARHAFAFVTGTSVHWKYSEPESRVTTRYSFDDPDGRRYHEAPGRALPPPLDAAGPGTDLSGYELPSVRGPIRMAAVDSFETELPFGGLLPVWPVTGSPFGATGFG